MQKMTETIANCWCCPFGEYFEDEINKYNVHYIFCPLMKDPENQQTSHDETPKDCPMKGQSVIYHFI
jgi:hypothetical protein